MKKHLSVFMLISRSTIYKVIALFVAMAALEGALFYISLDKALTRPIAENSVGLQGLQGVQNLQAQQPVGLESLFTKSLIPWVFAVAFLLLTVLLCLTGCEFGSKQGYTLGRLSISGRSIFMWQALYNTICFFLLWAVQLAVALALCKLYIAKIPTEAVSGQTVLLAFYRNSFLHSLLPLDETSRYICNVFLIIGLGTSSAGFPFKQRRGKFGVNVALLVSTCLVFFTRSMGGFGNDILMILIAITVAAESIYRACKGETYSEAQY